MEDTQLVSQNWLVCGKPTVLVLEVKQCERKGDTQEECFSLTHASTLILTSRGSRRPELSLRDHGQDA